MLDQQREFASFAFVMPQGCQEAGLTGPSIKLVLWLRGDSHTLNIPKAAAEGLRNSISEALDCWPVAEALLAPIAGED